MVQFNPQRYPKDVEFRVKGTMGIVAREFEQSNLTALLSVVPPDSPAYPIILQGVVELSGTPKRDELLKAIEQAFAPNPEAEAMQKRATEAEIRSAELENAKLEAEVAEVQSKQRLNDAKTAHVVVQTELEDDLVEIQAANAVIGREKAVIMKQQLAVAKEKNSIERVKAKKSNNGSSR
jgi:hypothetical protein